MVVVTKGGGSGYLVLAAVIIIGNPEPGLEIFSIKKCFSQAGPLFHM